MRLAASMMLIITLQLLISACAGVTEGRVSGHSSSDIDADMNLVSYHHGVAAQVLEQLHTKNLVFEDSEARSIVDQILARLLPEASRVGINIVFTHLPGENALALANGTILIHQSLLATVASEPQLAFLLAHEIAHVNLSHAWSTTRSSLSTRFDRHAFGREQEREADQYAARLLVQAGYDLVDASGFFTQLANYPVAYPGLEKSRTHPQLAQRKQSLLKAGKFTLAVNYNGAASGQSTKSTELSRKQFARFRIRQLVHSIHAKTTEADLPGALVQLADLETLTGSGDQTTCLRANIYAAIGADFAAARDAMKELLRGEATGESAYQQEQELKSKVLPNGFFRDQAETLYREVLAQSPDTNCAVRGLSALLAQR